MKKVVFEKEKYVIYANNPQEANILIGQELSRFDTIRYLMSELITENGTAWQNFMDNTSEERLNIYFHDSTSLIFGEDAKTKGKVMQQMIDDKHVKIDENGNYFYELAYRYPDIDGQNANFRLAREMGYLLVNPSNINKQSYDEKTHTKQISGLIRVPKMQEHNPDAVYGEKMQESAINLLAQLAIRGTHSADDILMGKIDLSEQDSYKKCDDLVKLLVVSMRNDFDKKISFEQLMKQKIDSTIKHSDGTQEPANIFFYGMLNDSSIIEKEFDKYMGKGAWRQLDSLIAQLHQPDIRQEEFDTIFESAQGIITRFSNTRMQEKQQQEQTQLSSKQKVAQFLRKHNVFMNLGFVENFVNKQLNVLPTPKKTGEIAANRLRQDFEKRLSDDGKLKEIMSQGTIAPPIAENRQEKDKVEIRGR